LCYERARGEKHQRGAGKTDPPRHVHGPWQKPMES
jgi:hypothetical protein